MTREVQDKLWNELSEEQKTEYSKEFQQESESYDINLKHCDEENGFEYRTGYSNGVITTLEDLFGSHNLNPKPLTYADVSRELFGYDNEKQYGSFCCPLFSKAHSNKISAINALICVAKYLNKDWKPNWENNEEPKWSIRVELDEQGNEVIKIGHYLGTNGHCNNTFVYFRTKELAQQAIQILGEEVIRLALSTDY